MSLQNLCDAIRVAGAAILIFGIVPLWLARTDGRLATYLGVIVRTLLFVEICALILGRWQLCLPGATAGLYCVAGLGLLWRTGRLTRLVDSEWWLLRLHRTLHFLNEGASSGRTGLQQFLRVRANGRSAWHPLVWVALALTLAVFADPLQHASFRSADTYSRALSLQTLTLGQRSAPDGSVAFLAPVVFLSGADGAAVVRYSNPLLVLALVCISGMTAFFWRKSLTAGLAAAGLAFAVACSPLLEGELSRGAISAIFWLSAIALARVFKWDAAAGMGLALLAGTPDLYTVLCVSGALAVCAVSSICRGIPAGLRKGIAAVAITFCFTVGAYSQQKNRNAGPVQYESVASEVIQITRDLPRNRWLVVSPGQELPFVFGHGWHVELSEFVASHTVEQVSDPQFRFDYPVETLFVIVEKRPLRSARTADPLYSLVFEPNLAYQSAVYREAMEYQAGELLAAYTAHHPDADLYFEDHDASVYRIRIR